MSVKILFQVILCFLLLVLAFTVRLAGDEDFQTINKKTLLLERCTKCHNIGRIDKSVGKFSAEKWDTIVNRMVRKGAKLTPIEAQTIVEYLSAKKED
ncbi:MAG: hypothetical protein ABII88_00070 [Candidatus Omnitrophota bacterium]